MRKQYITIILIAAAIILAIPAASVNAGTPGAHFTHNRHDTLLLGEIIAMGGDSITIKSAGFIVSAGIRHQDHEGNYITSSREVARNLRREARRLLRPEVALVYMANIQGNSMWWPFSPWEEYFGVGDYVIASLDVNPDGDGFAVAWGIYKVSSLNYRRLSVHAGDNGGFDLSNRYTAFVNSRGYGGYFIPVGERPPTEWQRFVAPVLFVVIIAGAVVMLALSRNRQY